jgi:post-segregation antitoxin (ccd killing protein)
MSSTAELEKKIMETRAELLSLQAEKRRRSAVISISTTKDLKQQLTEAAKDRDMTVSSLVSIVMYNWLEQQEGDAVD